MRLCGFSMTLGKKPIPLVWKNATKQSVVQQLTKSRTVLISSHGIYLPQVSEGTERGIAIPDPFDRSCLLLLPDQGQSPFELLRASEILSLDLSNCDVVVLSACSTGTGGIVESQGSY